MAAHQKENSVAGSERDPSKSGRPTDGSSGRSSASEEALDRARSGGPYGASKDLGRPLSPLVSFGRNPWTIFGLTGAAMLICIAVLFSLPAPDVPGRIVCLIGIIISYSIGQVWYELSRAQVAAARLRNDDEAVDGLELEMERLEDVKWQLNDGAARYRDLLDQHQDMIIRLDDRGALTFANRAFRLKFDIISDRDARAQLKQCVRQTIELDSEPTKQSNARRIRQLMATLDGERWIEWELHDVPSGEGHEIQHTGRDVTDTVYAQDALKEARDKAQSANRAKSRFLASMSHEIRTPMNGILGMANLLNDETLSDKQQSYVGAIELSARNLLAIIDEILDFSRLEAGKIKLVERYFSIEDIVLSVTELLAPSAQEKGLEIAWTVERNALGEFYGDAARVRQVLLNLISNAVKFTDTGGVRIAVTAKPDNADNKNPITNIELRISDTGIGISKADQKVLFSEFGQTDDALKRQSGGTGLGLAISKRIAEAMGGGLTVESEPGDGSTFVARFRLKPVFGVDASNNFAALRDSLHLNVLLAFDRTIERTALTESLVDGGISVVACDFAEAAVEIEKAARRGKPFTRIVVDAEIDTSAAADVLQGANDAARMCGVDDRVVRGLVMVNMLSRDALPKFQDVGYDAYIVRPARTKTVFEQLFAEPQPSNNDAGIDVVPDDPRPSAMADAPLNFLLVEDNDINALLVENQLRGAGHQVVRCTTGREAITYMRRALDGATPAVDVILMDVMLPDLDGLQATVGIRKLYQHGEAQTQPPAIIALTANAFEEDRQRCLDAGMDDYLAKPFDHEMLKVVLGRCLQRAP